MSLPSLNQPPTGEAVVRGWGSSTECVKRASFTHKSIYPKLDKCVVHYDVNAVKQALIIIIKKYML
jgi:hypothetical protein